MGELVYLRNFLDELRYKQKGPTRISQDNKQTIAIIKNDGNQKRARGFDINYRMVQDFLRRKVTELVFVRSRDMPADSLNKGTGINIFKDFKQFLGLEDISGLRRMRRDIDLEQD